jgi:drug/metabolite transporter (DMT)-like permease
LSAARAPQASVWSSLLLLVAALLCFAVLDTTTKRVTEVVPPMMAVWVLFLVQAIASTTFVGVRRGLGSLKTAHWQLQIVRGALLLAVQLLAFFSLMVLPVGEFTAMAMTTPLLVTLFAARVLGEHVSLLRLLLVGGGLTGTLIIQHGVPAAHQPHGTHRRCGVHTGVHQLDGGDLGDLVFALGVGAGE